jgi:hypothetical protein
MEYLVRTARLEDLCRIEEIYAYARTFMAETGNPNQWGKTNPPTEQLLLDIDNRLLFVIENESGIHGVFYFYIGIDTINNEVCDKWQKIELYDDEGNPANDDNNFTWTSSAKNYIYTNRITTWLYPENQDKYSPLDFPT